MRFAKSSCENYGFAIPSVVSAGGSGKVMRSKQTGWAKKGAAVAKIIEFYIPSNFKRKEKWIPPQNRGKVIEFSLQTRRSA